VAPGIDWDQIALKFELTGGFIKNAVLSALLLAISRDPERPLIEEADVAAGCKLQMRGSLKMRAFSQRVVPRAGLDSMVLADGDRASLQEIVDFEKARAVLFGGWGFRAPHHRPGSTALLWGPAGTGKSAAAAAIGFEVGRPLKVVSCAQLLLDARRGARGKGGEGQDAGADGKARSGAGAIFDDARLMEAVLVVENVDVGRFAPSEDAGETTAVQLLLHEIERFPGLIVLVWTTPAGALTAGMETAVPAELRRRLQWMVEFRLPRQDERARLWRAMIPDAVPRSKRGLRAGQGAGQGGNHETARPEFDWETLSRTELTGAQISAAVVRAAARAALRPKGKQKLRQSDLEAAARAERNRAREGQGIERMFT
jgi:SpoVK/Ycf46/Vps4 family AAA+-type ATPase